MEPSSPPHGPAAGLRNNHAQRNSLSDFRAQNNGPVPVPNRPPGLHNQNHNNPQQPFGAPGHSRNASNLAGGPPLPLARSPPNKNTTHVPCKFFKQGNCQAGAACPFDHSMEPEPPCKYFMKGNCKFGAKCALAHILPDGRRVNKPRMPHMNQAQQFYAQHPDQSPMYPPVPAVMPPHQPYGQPPFTASEDQFPAHSRPGQRDAISGAEGPFGSPTGSNFGSPPNDGRLHFSPKGLTALETPFPASFDSTSISLVAQHHKKFGESVPNTFGWGPLASTSPPASAANHQAFGNLNSLARADRSDSTAYKQFEASSPPANSNLLSPRLRAADAQPRRIIHSDRRTASYNIAHSVGARPQFDGFAGLGKRSDEMPIDEDDDQLEEDCVPHSLSELLTPQEKMRRFSRSEADHGFGSRPPRSSYGSPPIGSPSHNSPSRYAPLFANRVQQQQQQREEGEGPGPSPFGHVGSPLRNASSFGGRAGENVAEASSSLGAISRPAKTGSGSTFAASGARNSGVGLISEQLRKAGLGGEGTQAPSHAQTPAGPMRTISSSSVGSAAEGKAGRLDRAMSSTSVGRERIDEEDGVFSLDELDGDNSNKGKQSALTRDDGVASSGKQWSDVAAGRPLNGARANGSHS